jgi:hypothetical protein
MKPAWNLYVLRIVLCNPTKHNRAKLVSAFDEFTRLGVGDQSRMIVIHLIALLTTCVKVVDTITMGSSEDNPSRLKRRHVMPAL